MSETVTADQLANFLRRTGKAGARTLSVLGKYQPFMEALKSSVGRELLAEAMIRHEILLDKVASLSATDDEKAEYQAIRKILLRWSEKIANYETSLKKVSDGGRDRE